MFELGVACEEWAIDGGFDCGITWERLDLKLSFYLFLYVLLDFSSKDFYY